MIGFVIFNVITNLFLPSCWSGDSHVITTVIKLDWSSEEDITTLISSHQQQVNVVIATGELYCLYADTVFLYLHLIKVVRDGNKS